MSGCSLDIFCFFAMVCENLPLVYNNLMKNSNLLAKSGMYIIICAAIFPLLLWLPMATFTSPSSLFLSIGQALALSSVILYSINFILATRLRIFEPFFGGLNRMYIVHHLVGAAAFILVLFHPLFIALSYAFLSVDAAVALLIPSLDNLPVWFGIVALIATIVLLIITLYIKLEYDLWKKTHKFLGGAFFLIAVHVFLTKSFLDSMPVLKGYVYIFMFLALLSFIYKTLLGRFLVRKRAFTVTKITEVVKDIWEIDLDTVDHKPYWYHSGQFIFINPKNIGIANEEHPFSVVSKANELPLVLASKTVGSFTTTLKLLQKGDKVLVEGPYGRFGWEYYPAKKQIWIAGGIGITPFVSMARTLPSQGYQVDLYYTVKDKSEAAYLEDLVAVSGTNPNFRVFLISSKERGRLTAEIVKVSSQIFPESTFFVCGPPPMMKSMREQLNKLGVKNTKIHTEEFSLN